MRTFLIKRRNWIRWSGKSRLLARHLFDKISSFGCNLTYLFTYKVERFHLIYTGFRVTLLFKTCFLSALLSDHKYHQARGMTSWDFHVRSSRNYNDLNVPPILSFPSKDIGPFFKKGKAGKKSLVDKGGRDKFMFELEGRELGLYSD